MENEYKEYLGSCIDVKPQIDVNRLPKLLRGILTQFLVPLCVGVPKESLLIDLNVKLAQLISHNRVKVRIDDSNYVPLNYYGVIFMPSGSGKDKPIKFIDKYLLKDFNKKFYEQSEKYRNDKTNEIIEIAEEKFPSSKAGKEKYIQDNRPRYLVKDMGDGTLEGFVAMRQAFEEAGFGSTFIKLSEFGDFIMSNNNARGELLSLVWDVYDTGDNEPKVIKGEREILPVRDVPSNALFHTALSGLYTDDGRKKLLTFFNRGLARRCFICYPIISTTLQGVSDIRSIIEGRLALKRQALGNTDNFVRQINFIYESISKKYTAVDNHLTLSEEAEFKLEVYKLYNEYRAEKINSFDEQEGLRAEIKTRDWKTLKLAGLIAVIEHPQSPIITVKDVEYAIYQTEVFGLHLKRFYENDQPTELDRVFAYLEERLDQWVKLGEIRNKKFVPDRDFANWFGDQLEELREISRSKGYNLEFQTSSKNSKQYRLTKI